MWPSNLKAIGTRMLPIYDLPTLEINKIRMACAYLFSPEKTRDDEFLKNLKFELVRHAFTEKAKQYHPDLHHHEPPQMIERRRERFIKIRESYEILKKYIHEEPYLSTMKREYKRTVIAVGGAKGGIGKSLFSANLGVFLSRTGNRTVLVDLDLGGANLHLYLGETSLPYSINDFLSQKVSKLEDVMMATKYGPKLIGGNSSQLGAANINFGMKLKLLRSIRMLEADYIIIDLGGDTSYNIIDFFLVADHGLVLTTCDPASYLDAYTFIKVSLYRKLNRLFGVELKPGTDKNATIIRLIEEATMSKNGRRVKTIAQLMERIRQEQPEYKYIINRILREFHPYLVVNMIESDSDMLTVVKRIQEVAYKTLSIDVEFLGALPYQPEIKWSARELVPVITKSPNGYLSKMMAKWVDKIIHRTFVNGPYFYSA